MYAINYIYSTVIRNFDGVNDQLITEVFRENDRSALFLSGVSVCPLIRHKYTNLIRTVFREDNHQQNNNC